MARHRFRELLAAADVLEDARDDLAEAGLSMVSRRSVSASMMLTPALRSCERWKQKVMSSGRVTRRVRAALPRFTDSAAMRSSPRRRSRSSRSITLTASRLPAEIRPSASTARYAKSAMPVGPTGRGR
jgi:hypothetical protein